MDVVLLGTGSADGWPNPFCACASCLQQGAAGIRRGPTSALVDDVLLLDCGTGVPAAALAAGRRLDRLRAVLLTHDHPDHSAPMALLARAWAKGKTEPLQVIGPAAVLDTWRPWCGPNDTVTFLPVDVGDRRDVAGYTVTVLAAAHEQPAVLYLVEDPAGRRLLWASDTGPLPEGAVAALSEMPVDLLLLEQTFGDWLQHGTQHLDLSTFPRQLARLREVGAVRAGADVVAVHLSHHNPPEPRLASRLAAWGARAGRDGEVIQVTTPKPAVIWGHHPLAGAGSRHHLPRRTLIVGGARSGKSTTAERLLAAEPKVLYLATGPAANTSDEAWADRVRRHREQRPATWTTVETSDAATVLRTHSGPVLFDCVGTWLAAAMDDVGAWDDRKGWESELQLRIDELTAAWRAVTGPVVAVSNEVGSGVVPATRSGGLYRDWLGRLNQRLAGESERVLLIVAGRIVDLSDDA
jgi:adenosylcobinamide kinase / adenosylcobinamide-phosphate guanylyltransferase